MPTTQYFVLTDETASKPLSFADLAEWSRTGKLLRGMTVVQATEGEKAIHGPAEALFPHLNAKAHPPEPTAEEAEEEEVQRENNRFVAVITVATLFWYGYLRGPGHSTADDMGHGIGGLIAGMLVIWLPIRVGGEIWKRLTHTSETSIQTARRAWGFTFIITATGVICMVVFNLSKMK